jgi:hypothetical protein
MSASTEAIKFDTAAPHAGWSRMKINISHTKNAVLGWDIDVSVQAEGEQKIGQVEVRINDVPEAQDLPGDALISWGQQLTQKGYYPGSNKVEVTVSDQDGDETRAEQKWYRSN